MDNWPVELQQKLNATDFTLKYGTSTARTDMDVGPAKVRSRYTTVVDTYSCSILIDYDQFATFTSFYKTTLANGTLPFLFNDPFTQAPATFRFADVPTLSPVGGRTFTIGMAWEKIA